MSSGPDRAACGETLPCDLLPGAGALLLERPAGGPWRLASLGAGAARLLELPSPADLDLAAVLARVEPEQRAMLLGLADAPSGDGSCATIVRLGPAEGPPRWAQLRAAVRPRAEGGHALHLLLTDVTELHASREALRVNEERLRLALGSWHRGLFDWDVATGRVVWDRGHYELLGYEPFAFEPTFADFAARIEPDDMAVIEARLARALETREDTRLEYRVRLPDGTIRWVRGTGSFIEQPGGTLRMIGIIEDITERRRLEEGMRETQRLESLGVLAGGIAHDFNNLLAAILGNAEVAATALPDGGEARAAVERVMQASRRAATLCQQLLAYAGKGQLAVGPVHLSALVQDTLMLLERAVSRSARLELSLADDLPAVEGDAGQLRQVVMNLVLNGAEALGPGGGRLRLATRRVDVPDGALDGWLLGAGRAPGPFVELKVEDTGSGMDEATRARIFEPFFTTKFAGRGLGLSAVLGIVRSHHGALDVTSTPGAGTRFRVRFPAAGAAAPAASGGSPSVRPADAAPRGDGTLLVVDDEDDVRQATAHLARSLGYEVVEVPGGDAAVAAVRARPDAFRSVLLDLTMPGRDGVEVLGEVLAAAPELPVIMMSGYAEREVLERVDGRGLAGYLQKPFTRGELAAKLHEAVAARTR